MARTQSPADLLLSAVIKRAVVPALEPLGFRKAGTSFRRRHGSVLQLVNLQSSHGSDASTKLVYVNVGLAFDGICGLLGCDIPERPKEYECDRLGVRGRLESFIEGVPERWSFEAGHDEPQPEEARFSSSMQVLAAGLATIDGPSSFRAHAWFGRSRPSSVAAQVLYLLGEFDAARAEADAIAAGFAGRSPLDTAAHWIEQLGLTTLAD